MVRMTERSRVLARYGPQMFTKTFLKLKKRQVKEEPVKQKKNGRGDDKMSSKKTPKNKKEISFGIIKYPYAGRRVSHGKGIGPGRSA